MLTWLADLGWWLIPLIAATLVATLIVSAVVGTAWSVVYSFLIAPWLLFKRKPQSARYARRKLPAGLTTAMLREVWTVILFVGLYPLGRLARDFNTTVKSQGPPIILVHGYGVSTMSWYWFMRLLVRKGANRPMYALKYNWLAPVEESSQDLAQLIARAMAEQNATQVDLVAHSWGGFLSRWYIERLGHADRVRHLIMISTPLQGTWTSLLALGGPRRAMKVGGALVLSLETAPPAPPYATLWSECDSIVAPPQLCLLAEPDGNRAYAYRFTGIAHLTMQRDAQVAALVAALCTDPDAWAEGRD